MIEHTGWTWDYVAKNMDIPRLMSMNDYKSTRPSLRSMVQAYLGINPTKSTDKTEADNSVDDLNEFIQMFTGAGGKTG